MSKTVWVFDVDGVITSLFTKKITEPAILEFIAKKLEFGDPVIFNTGRGLDWTILNVINLLLEKIKDNNSLENFLVVGEKGGVWLTINKNGAIKKEEDKSLLIPASLAQKIRAFGINYSDRMFEYERTKKTMLSFEIRTGLELEQFTRLQEETVPKIEKIIEDFGLSNELKVDPTRIGTDIQHRKVGKGFAMERILSWLKEKRFKPEKITCFGDSKSDFEMAQKAHEQGFQTEFVYVGGDNAFENIKTEIIIIATRNKYDKGTLEFLQAID